MKIMAWTLGLCTAVSVAVLGGWFYSQRTPAAVAAVAPSGSPAAEPATSATDASETLQSIAQAIPEALLPLGPTEYVGEQLAEQITAAMKPLVGRPFQDSITEERRSVDRQFDDAAKFEVRVSGVPVTFTRGDIRIVMKPSYTAQSGIGRSEAREAEKTSSGTRIVVGSISYVSVDGAAAGGGLQVYVAVRP